MSNDGINKVTLYGNIGTDPELKTTSAGPVLKFRLATGDSWNDKVTNEKKERVEWHNITVFGKRGETLVKHLHKGDRLYLDGELRTSSYDKEGQKHYKTEVIVNDLRFAGSRSRSNGALASAPSSQQAMQTPF